MRKILISETLDEIRVAVVDNSRLRNFFIDNNREQISIRGNIYKAEKNPNASGIEASFVDIGFGKSAFLSKNYSDTNNNLEYQGTSLGGTIEIPETKKIQKAQKIAKELYSRYNEKDRSIKEKEYIKNLLDSDNGVSV